MGRSYPCPDILPVLLTNSYKLFGIPEKISVHDHVFLCMCLYRTIYCKKIKLLWTEWTFLISPFSMEKSNKRCRTSNHFIFRGEQRNRNMFKFKIPAKQARSRDGVWRPGWKTQYFHWYWRIRIIAAWARKIENILIPHHSSIPFFPHLLGDGSVPVDVHGPEEALQRSLLTHELLERELPVKISIHPIEEFCHFLPVIANSFTFPQI